MNVKRINDRWENISISEFLPSLTISGSQTSTETSNIVDQSGSSSGNTKRNTETKFRQINLQFHPLFPFQSETRDESARKLTHQIIEYVLF